MKNYTYTDHTIDVNDIKLHYIEYKNDRPKLLLMHGLTANAHAFEGFIRAGLADHFHVLSIDFRGRGLSAKVAFQYNIKEHAEDVIGLLDQLGIEQIIMCGHSFGGLMSTYLAYHFPSRVSKVIILDAAPEMNPKTGEMLMPALSRLDTQFENFETYIQTVKAAPYNTPWDDAMEIYYKADVATHEDGSVEPISNLADIIQVATNVSKEDWTTYFESFAQPALLVVALNHYTLDQPLLPTEKAKAILAKMKHAQYLEVNGNHQTMLYGRYALQIVQAIHSFCTQA